MAAKKKSTSKTTANKMAKKKTTKKKTTKKKTSKKKSVAKKTSPRNSARKSNMSSSKKAEIDANLQLILDGIAELEANNESQNNVVWDDEGLETEYATVFRVLTGRRGMLIALGNVASRGSEGDPSIVDVAANIGLNPFAAKRLAKLMNNVVEEYESTYGELVFKNEKN